MYLLRSTLPTTLEKNFDIENAAYQRIVPSKKMSTSQSFGSLKDVKQMSFSTPTTTVTTTFLCRVMNFLQPSAVQASTSILALILSTIVIFKCSNGMVLSESFWGIINVWDGLLHTSSLFVMSFTLMTSIYIGHKISHETKTAGNTTNTRSITKCQNTSTKCYFGVLFVLCVMLFNVTITSQLQIAAPAWFWNPFLWFGSFKIYYPSDVSKATNGLCLDYTFRESDYLEPLCLSEESWKILSAGSLSSNNYNDVAAVIKGIEFAKSNTCGMVVNIMCRDCAEAIPTLKENIDNLRVFFPTLAVVIFENDSDDGSRNLIEQWAAKNRSDDKYEVDLIDCEEAVDCRFGISHRYDSTEAKDYFTSSSVGKMAEFRQRIVDHVTSNQNYDSYSHMLVMDMDLGVSISPLGLLHSIGEVPESPVASSGRQTWPGSSGSLVPPYDFSAFRSIETKRSQLLKKMDALFCGMMPAGHRWRNMCDAVSSSHMIQILDGDRGSEDIYSVKSAFNGATLYPLKLIRETTPKPKYDQGSDGQRCEHIGFNFSLQKTMFVNRKWSFNIQPSRPGGPTGIRALRNIAEITIEPSLGLVIFLQHLVCYLIFVIPVMNMGVYVLYPLMCMVWVAFTSQYQTVVNNYRSIIDLKGM